MTTDTQPQALGYSVLRHWGAIVGISGFLATALLWFGALIFSPAKRMAALEARVATSDAIVQEMSYQLTIIARVVCQQVEQGNSGSAGDLILLDDCRAITRRVR